MSKYGRFDHPYSILSIGHSVNLALCVTELALFKRATHAQTKTFRCALLDTRTIVARAIHHVSDAH